MQTGNLVSNFITLQYKLDLMARFMETKLINSKLKQSEIAKELGCSSSALKGYRQDIKMLSPYRIPPNSRKKRKDLKS